MSKLRARILAIALFSAILILISLASFGQSFQKFGMYGAEYNRVRATLGLYIPYGSAPTTNSADPNDHGLYFDLSVGKLKVWDGAAWQILGVSDWNALANRPTEFTPSNGSAYYIQNQTAAPQVAGMRITGVVQAGEGSTNQTVFTGLAAGSAGYGANFSNSYGGTTFKAGGPVYAFEATGAGNISGGLTLGGALRHANLAADPAGLAGMVYYNTATPGFKAYINSGWTSLLSGALTSGYIPVASGSGALANSSMQDYTDPSGFHSLLLPVHSSASAAPPAGTIHVDNTLNRIVVKTVSGYRSTLFQDEFYSFDGYLQLPQFGTASTGIGAMRFDMAANRPTVKLSSGSYIPYTLDGQQSSFSHYLYNSATDPNNIPAANGMTYYNTTTPGVKAYINGAWDYLASQSYVNGQIRTGNYIYVDANNPNATDTRGSYSKYSLTTPFRTIQAAVNASLYTDVIYVRAGTYNENVVLSPNNSINSVALTYILDNCTVNGGTGDAITTNGSGAYGISLYMINSTLKSTGAGSGFNSSVSVNTIFGNSSATCFITSNSGYGYKGTSSVIKAYNISFTSTSGFAYADIGGGAGTQYFNLCAFTSTSGSAVQSGTGVLTLDQCNVTASSLAFDGVGTCSVIITNSILTSNNGSTIGASNFFVGTPTPINATVYNSQLTGYTSIFNLPFATGPLNVTYSATNNKYNVTNGSSVFTINTSGHTTWLGSGSLIKVANSISNQPIFSSSDRTTYGFAFKESNTNTTNTIYYGLNVGFGSITPTSAIDATGANGYNQLRLRTQYTPTGSADTNGNPGDVSVDDNYIYFKTSTGWKRAALATF